MHRGILVPLDASAFGEQALAYAESIVERGGAELTLLHVHEALDVDGLVPDARWDERVVERERAYLDETAERVRARTGAAVSTVLRRGEPVAEITGQIEERGIDLVVMTTHGRTGIERGWLGSTADGVVRQSPAPVLLVRPRDDVRTLEPTFEHVLVPLDGTQASARIVDHVAPIVRLGGARVTLLRVLPGSIIVGGHVFYFEEERMAEATGRAEDYLRAAAERLRDAARDVETVVVAEASPAAAILDWAAEHDVDLIAMATRGQAGLRRWLLGSVADKVVRSSYAPILLHRSPGDDGAG